MRYLACCLLAAFIAIAVVRYETAQADEPVTTEQVQQTQDTEYGTKNLIWDLHIMVWIFLIVLGFLGLLGLVGAAASSKPY